MRQHRRVQRVGRYAHLMVYKNLRCVLPTKTPATQGSILTTMSEDVDSDRPTSTVRLRNRAAARSGRKLRDMELPQRHLRWGVSTPELPGKRRPRCENPSPRSAG